MRTSRTKITLTNDFHNTEVTLIARDGTVSYGQFRKAVSALCGMIECRCGAFRGSALTLSERADGSYDVIDHIAEYAAYAEWMMRVDGDDTTDPSNFM